VSLPTGFGHWLLIGLIIVLMQSVSVAETGPVERIEWTRTPIRMTLGVGHERLVHFPAPVSVGVPGAVEAVLRTQSVNGTVYFLAKAPFATTRIMVREIDSGQMYLFDVSAEIKAGATHPVAVFVGQQERAASAEASATRPDARHSFVALTRFAAQQLYSPLRLLGRSPGFVQVPVPAEPVELVPGGTVEAVPLVAWRAGGLYVTAVKLTNRSLQAQVLDPRTLRGAWRAATFQHSRLLPAGDEADTTAAYLISDHAFEAAF